MWDVEVNIVLMEMKEREKCAPRVNRHIDDGSISFSTADDASVKLRRISIRECYCHINNYGGSPLEFKVPDIFLLGMLLQGASAAIVKTDANIGSAQPLS